MLKKILIINTLYYPHMGGGAEVICKELSEGLYRKGFDVTVLATGNENCVEQINGVKVIRRKIKNVYWHYKNSHNALVRLCWHAIDSYNYASFLDAKKQIEQINPAVVIVHNVTGFSASIINAIKELNIPFVQILHDQYFRCANSNAFRKDKQCKGQCARCKILRLPHRKLTSKADVVVGVSSFVLESLTNLGFFKSSIKQVIHNARVFPTILEPKKWHSSEPLRLGFIGTITHNKGIEWLIETFISLKINAELYIAGVGEEQYENVLKEKCKNDKRIFFEGYMKSVEHYKKVHISVVPSLWPDTFPTVAFESCVHGRPVIASKVGGLPEIIKHDVNGFLVDPNENNSLKKAISILYNNPAYTNSLISNTQESVKKFTDTDSWIDQYINILNNLS